MLLLLLQGRVIEERPTKEAVLATGPHSNVNSDVVQAAEKLHAQSAGSPRRTHQQLGSYIGKPQPERKFADRAV